VTRAIVIMGVSGCGKSTLGRELADALGVPFVEGDTLHPEANVVKMRAGIALDDSDREPFLARVADALVAAGPRGAVVSCSALKRSYRDLIRARAGAVTFVWQRLDRAALAARLAQRHDHYMPASLLDSQLAALEPPAEDEQAIEIDGAETTAAQVAYALAALDNPTEPQNENQR
jgi:carbohydrate kinase (thermoresistant glucokinase family)